MNVNIYARDEIDPQKWDEFIRQSPQYIIYGLSGYLDCVCNGWNAIIAMQGGRWVAAMPFNTGRKFGMNYSLKPSFLQYLGIFFSPFDEISHRTMSIKKEGVERIIEAIPKNIKLFNHNFSPRFDFFLPFTWHGFEVKPFHSYCLRIDRPLEEIYKNFSVCCRNRIRKSEKLSLKCVRGNSVAQLVQIMQGRNIISTQLAPKLLELWRFIGKERKGFTLYLTNPQTGRIYCGGAFVMDGERLILLASALDFQFKETGANTMMIWEAIQYAHASGGISIFDFTGSMIESVENYIRGFGTEPVLYLNISRNRLPLPYSVGFAIREKMRRNKINAAKEELASPGKQVFYHLADQHALPTRKTANG